MGFFDELKKLTRPYDDDDDDFFGSASDDQPAGEPEEQPRSARRSSFFSDPEEAAPESVGVIDLGTDVVATDAAGNLSLSKSVQIAAGAAE